MTFHSHWGWLSTIDSLSKGERTKWDYYFNMNCVEFLNELAFRKDKREQVGKEIINLVKGKTSEQATVLLLSYLIQKT